MVQSCGFMDDNHARGYGAVVYTTVVAAGKVGVVPNGRATKITHIWATPRDGCVTTQFHRRAIRFKVQCD